MTMKAGSTPTQLELPLTGLKYDKGKPQLSLVPVELLEGTARALEHGVKKYGRNNFKGGLEWSRLVDAALRHIYAFAHKEDIDADSGNQHLDHAAASLAMLMHHVKNGVGKDDR